MLDLHALVDSASDAALIVDTDGVVRVLNAAAHKLIGTSPPSAVGITCFTLLGGRDSAGFEVCTADCPILEMAAKGICPRSFDMEIKTSTGRRWVNLSLLAAKNNAGQPLSIHLLHDIQARRKLEEAARLFLEQIGGLTGHELTELLSFSPTPHPDLTARELAVLELLVDGRSTQAISRTLGLSVSTVRNHIQHLLRKLSAHSRVEAVMRAVHDKLV